ncbi:unnamed protein product [Moneuplotes crassus]|uniref:Uncharacterized protein n=1 Tax=Euplotes crassus TaxID=5936 RepID=A0AAD1UDC1_EUPCR|nr:unnamed protein product [Moneuplotes crassus]
MGCNSSAAVRKSTADPRREECRLEILENIQDNDNIVQENNRMLCMIDRQIASCKSSRELNRLKKLKSKLIRENQEVTVHSDVLKQYSVVASEKSNMSQNVLSN